MSNYVDLPVPRVSPDTGGGYLGFEPLHWVKEHCPSYITNNVVQIQAEYFYRFYFAQEQDQIMFTLRWL